MRSRLLIAVISALTLVAVVSTSSAVAQDKVTFGTNWKAQAEHGGFYQAVATGLYKKHGLEVTIRMGGPQVNHAQLLAAGAIDFNIGSSSFGALNYVKNAIPMVTVAALFQKDPQVLLAHPGQGNDTLSAMKGKPILISAGARATYWNFLKARYAFTDEQIRPYTFNMAPFLTDKSAIIQGYATSEPLKLEQAGVKPVVHLLADAGYNSYACMIETSWKLVREKPGLVQHFVDASIEGWLSYLYGDPEPGNALIKRDNPDMTDELIAYGIASIKKHGLVDSGDAKTLGVGAMTDARWKEFLAIMSEVGLYPRDLDLTKAYTLQFVNKRVGLKPAK